MSSRRFSLRGMPRGAKRSLTDIRFGRLLVRDEAAPRAHPGGQIARRWNCQCDCGADVTIAHGKLATGHTRSCGCLRRESAAAQCKTHGGTNSPEYQSWRAMKARCLNPRNDSFEHYGAREVSVCARWLESFAAFLEDMGPRPGPEHSIDRRDPDGNYEPGNCRWATPTEQARNRRNSRSRDVLPDDNR